MNEMDINNRLLEEALMNDPEALAWWEAHEEKFPPCPEEYAIEEEAELFIA